MRNNFLSASLNSVVSLDMDSSWAARSWDWAAPYWSPNSYQGAYKKPPVGREPLLGGGTGCVEPEPAACWSLSQGKVRQLFEGRRTCARGWDKSYPLEPLKAKHRSQPAANQQLARSVGNLTEEVSPLLSEKAALFKRLPNIGGGMQSQAAAAGETQAPTSGLQRKRVVSRIPQPNTADKLRSPVSSATKDLRKLNISPRKPQSEDLTTTTAKPRNTEIKRFSPQIKKDDEKPRQHKTAPGGMELRKTQSVESPSPPKSRTVSARSEHRGATPVSSGGPRTPAAVSSTPPPASRPPNPDMPQCAICGRYFNADRIALHEKICKKTQTKKRKVFDPVKHRLAGTDAESYLKKAPTASSKTAQQQKTPGKSNWRKKHEEFIANIRAAKQVKEHLAKGGKLSDLPPPPPLDTSDYTQCPHCSRKFNQTAADRHIPICANMKHNKPKKAVKK